MANSKIADKIVEDARQEAEAIIARYQAENERLRGEHQARIDQRRAAIHAEAESLEKTLMTRRVSRQRLAFNQDIVLRKQKMIKKVLDEAIAHLARSDDYPEFLRELIKNSNERDGTLTLSEDDFKNHGGEIGRFIKAENLNYEIDVDKDMPGGVIIKKDRKTYLGSLDIISGLLKDEISIAAVSILFKGENK